MLGNYHTIEPELKLLEPNIDKTNLSQYRAELVDRIVMPNSLHQITIEHTEIFQHRHYVSVQWHGYGKQELSVGSENPVQFLQYFFSMFKISESSQANDMSKCGRFQGEFLLDFLCDKMKFRMKFRRSHVRGTKIDSDAFLDP